MIKAVKIILTSSGLQPPFKESIETAHYAILCDSYTEVTTMSKFKDKFLYFCADIQTTAIEAMQETKEAILNPDKKTKFIELLFAILIIVLAVLMNTEFAFAANGIFDKVKDAINSLFVGIETIIGAIGGFFILINLIKCFSSDETTYRQGKKGIIRAIIITAIAASIVAILNYVFSVTGNPSQQSLKNLK